MDLALLGLYEYRALGARVIKKT